MFIIDGALVAVAAAVLARLVQRHLRRKAAPAPPAIATVNPMLAAAARLAALRPAFIEFPGITYLRGAWRTTAEAVTAWTRAKPAAAPIRVAGFEFDAHDLATKFTLAVGSAGAGKTTLMRLLTAEVARLLFGPDRIARRSRLVVVDPTGLFRDVVWSLPAHVAIYDMSLNAGHGRHWALADDVDTQAKAITFVASLVEESKGRNSDPFWVSKTSQLLKYVVITFQRLGSRAWRFSDVISALAYGGFVKPILALNPEAKSFVAGDLVGKLGRDILASGTAVTDKFSAAAALDQRAKRGLSMKDFLGTTDSVLYVSFTQPLIKPLGVYVSAMLSNLVTQALSRQVAPGEDLTYFVLDEGVYLKDVEFLSDIPKKGRGSGLGACMSVISLPALVQAFGKDRADEVVSNTRLTLALACDGATARHLSDLTGVTEALVETRSVGVTVNTGYTYTRGGGSGPGGSNRSWSESWTEGTSNSTTANATYMTRPCVLPSEFTNLPTPSNALRPGSLAGFAFTSDTGAFYFETDIAAEYARLAPIVPVPCPERAEGPLLPLTAADLARLRIDASDEAFVEALAAHDASQFP